MQPSKAQNVRVLPLPADLPVRQVIVKPGQGIIDVRRGEQRSAQGVTDCTGEEAYRNTQGDLFLVPDPGVLVADDIKLGCLDPGNLTCYEFTVFGGGDGSGAGFGLEFGLYDGCPGAGGQLIANTNDQIDLADDGAWAVTLDLTDTPVAAPSELWIATSEYTSNDPNGTPGWVFGAPAQIGVSEDNFHHPDFPCGSWFGGWPEFPHASFDARIFTESCTSTFVTFQSDAFSGEFHGGSVDELSADDIQPSTPVCNMVELRVDYAGTAGAYTANIDIRQDAAGVPGDIIAGTPVVFDGVGNGLLEQAVFAFDPPITLPSTFWVTNQDDSADAGPVVAGGPALIGSSNDEFAIFNGAVWDMTFFGGCDDGDDDPCGSFNMRITCQGDPPAGACCEIDECTNNVTLQACAGRFAQGEQCAVETFDPPCGAGACCLDNGDCVDLLESKCSDGNGVWQRGEFCGTGAQTCPAADCINADGSCVEANITPGCDNPDCCDAICEIDDFCCTVEWDDTCVGAALELDVCTADIAPDNDDFDTATPITDGSVAFTTIGASTDGTDYNGTPDCGEFGDDTVHQDVWYEYTAACNGNLTVTTCSDLGGGADFDTRLAVQDGCGSLLDPALGCNDDDPDNACGGQGSFQSTLVVPVTASNCYKVRVGGFQSGNAGNGTLNASLDAVDCECPGASFTLISPPADVVDARQPHALSDAADLLGIDSVVVEATANVASTACWSLCETSAGDPNGVSDVLDNGDGTYTVQLVRPISAGAVTTLSYQGAGEVIRMTSHPGNVNADSTASQIDILAMIDSLNGVVTPPFDVYSSDVDHSGMFNALDIIALIDVLNGANALDSWNGTPLPDGAGCP